MFHLPKTFCLSKGRNSCRTGNCETIVASLERKTPGKVDRRDIYLSLTFEDVSDKSGNSFCVSPRTVHVRKNIYIKIIIIYLRLWNLSPLVARFEVPTNEGIGAALVPESGLDSHAKSRCPSTCSVACQERSLCARTPTLRCHLRRVTSGCPQNIRSCAFVGMKSMSNINFSKFDKYCFCFV